jgi:muconolactone delta-isomerase
MQFLTVSRRLAENAPDGDLASLTEAECECARALYSQNFIRQIWHRGDIPGACLIVEAESEQQVRETLRTLPFFKAGMLDVVIIPLKPYAGFAPHASNRSLNGGDNGDQRWNSATL